jgi:hypothetical protein
MYMVLPDFLIGATNGKKMCGMGRSALGTLRHHEHDAELPEVIIKSSRGLYAEFVDHDLARTVGKAPTGAGARLEENPSATDLIGG